MKSFWSSATLTSSLALGVITINNSAAQAINIQSYTITPSANCYVDSRFGGTSCGTLRDNNGGFLATGLDGTDTGQGIFHNQISLFSYDLSSITDDLAAINDDSAFAVITAASINATQSSENINNPNNPDNGSGSATPRAFGFGQRIFDANGRVAIGLPSDPNDIDDLTYDLYFGADGIEDQLGSTLFSRPISAGATGTTPNTFTGDGLNVHLTDLINDGSQNLNFALVSASGFNSPPFFFAIDDLEAAPELEVDVTFFRNLPFDVFARAGSLKFDTWESAIRDETNEPIQAAEANFQWINGNNSDNQRVHFQLIHTGGTTRLVLSRQQSFANPFFDQTINTNSEDIEGYKIYTKVNTASCPNNTSLVRVAPGTSTQLRLDSFVDQDGMTRTISATQGVISAEVPNSSSIGSSNQESLVIPISSLASGAEKAEQVQGSFTISWDDGENPQTSCNDTGGHSRVQMLFQPLTSVPSSEFMPLEVEVPEDDNDDNVVSPQSVPEPATIIGLLLFGVAGVGFGRSSSSDQK